MKEKEPDMVSEKIKTNIFNSLSSVKEEEQITFLTQRLINAEAEKSKFATDLDRLKKENSKVPMLERKLSSAEKMLSKTELTKSKLEQLCRELNKAHKEEKEQNQQKFKLLKKTHDDTVAAFKKSLNEIQQSAQAKHEHDSKVEEVGKLTDNLNKLAEGYDERLKELKQLYEKRESDYKLMAKTKEEELGLLRNELDDVRKRIKEVWEENVGMKRELLNSEEKARLSLESEINLRKVLDTYSEKYGKLLKSLATSNESFDRVKKEMEKMNANMIKVETDSRKWRSKVETANKELKELSFHCKAKDETIALKDRQLAQLQELCRRLQKGGPSSASPQGVESTTESDTPQLIMAGSGEDCKTTETETEKSDCERPKASEDAQ